MATIPLFPASANVRVRYCRFHDAAGYAVRDGQRRCFYVDHDTHFTLLTDAVAYLLAADIVSGPLPIRLREVNHSVISTRNGFSRSRPCLLICI